MTIGIDELMIFCDQTAPGFKQQPFTLNGSTYATNGAVIVRLNKFLDAPTLDDISKETDTKLLDKERIYEIYQNSPTSELLPLPIITAETITCIWCAGYGYLSLCPECNGNGELEFKTEHNEYYVPCKTCLGIGQAPTNRKDANTCKHCNATGKVHMRNSRTDFGEFRGANWLLVKIATLPNVKFATCNKDMAKFVFDGGDGYLMGVKRPEGQAAA
ncbi:hypothetical protein L3Q72_06565 [Vibrio sp. JC009]|uniref:hypothetical protein n=1 Tax=Vibrio sp. JC009 TaxID=2912314 RepID=UPI0023B1BAD2|nr:hypothetical protein [Vibrio sp. JC009]WED23052.1 hypothetical protein L3Q72_06565 [Vibrio sp. JC009]